MKRALLAAGAVFALGACEQYTTLERRLSGFEVQLTTPVGAPDRRCLLPGTPTTAVDLTGCPTYVRDAAGRTLAKVGFTARAIDNRGELLETYNSVARLRVEPGSPDPAFEQLRFVDGIAQGTSQAQGPEVAFRGAFGDTWIWVVDDNAPPRRSEIIGLGQACSVKDPGICDQFNLSCINSKKTSGFDPQGLVYCSLSCDIDTDCSEGYECSADISDYGFLGGSRACVRRQATYAAGAAGPVHLLEPSIADVNRDESLVSSPFDKQFVEVKRGNLVVTAIQITGFWVTDTCVTPGYQGSGNASCAEQDRAQPEEFNHLFVYTFNRPDELFVGDRLVSVSGPISEFNGFTEMTFPLWEVDFDRSPQPVPDAIDLNAPIASRYPKLVERQGSCFTLSANPERLMLVNCDLAMERLEAARISVKVRSVVPIVDNSREANNFDRFGQWPVIVDDGSMDGRRFQLVTRDNVPFFDPRRLGGRMINQPITGNIRQVAFDDRSDPIWIIEPRDASDCAWCKN